MVSIEPLGLVPVDLDMLIVDDTRKFPIKNEYVWIVQFQL